MASVNALGSDMARRHLLQRCPRRLILAHIRRVDEHGLGGSGCPASELDTINGRVTAGVARHPGELLHLHQLVDEGSWSLISRSKPAPQLVQHGSGGDFVANFWRSAARRRLISAALSGRHRFLKQRVSFLILWSAQP